MSLDLPQLFGVTVLPPAVGAAPAPPAALDPALELLAVVHQGPRSVGDRLATGLGNAVRYSLAALGKTPYRPRTHGLSPTETRAWAAQVRALLAPQDGRLLVAYARDCHAWYNRLHRTIGDDAADPDWDMTSAKNVAPSAPEAYLAQTLAESGIPVQAQVGVSRHGGARRGGWFAAYWLDCAHRDVAYLLRIDIELDGTQHYRRERRERDEERNAVLQERGWYVVRLGGRILGKQNHHLALERLVALIERHRRAVVLARSDLPTLDAALAVSTRAVAEDAPGTILVPSPSPGSAPGQTQSAAASPRDEAAGSPCPTCGGALVLRKARRGQHAGSSFYGCSNYPGCRYIQVVAEP